MSPLALSSALFTLFAIFSIQASSSNRPRGQLMRIECRTCCNGWNSYTRVTSKIPIALALKYNTFTSTQQLLNEIRGGAQNNDSSRLTIEPQVERKASVIPPPAACIPELRVVELTKQDKYNYMYYPTCTRIERCGGCCSHDLLSCQPVDTEIVNFEVVVTQLVSGERPVYKGKDIIPVERHLKCRCDCIKKPSDCNVLQHYVKGECQCVCTNTDEQQKCVQDASGKKHWDPDLCLCKCYNEPECNTGSVFNKHTCSCEVQRKRNKFPGWYDTRITPSRRDEYDVAK